MKFLFLSCSLTVFSSCRTRNLTTTWLSTKRRKQNVASSTRFSLPRRKLERSYKQSSKYRSLFLNDNVRLPLGRKTLRKFLSNRRLPVRKKAMRFIATSTKTSWITNRSQSDNTYRTTWCRIWRKVSMISARSSLRTQWMPWPSTCSNARLTFSTLTQPHTEDL